MNAPPPPPLLPPPQMYQTGDLATVDSDPELAAKVRSPSRTPSRFASSTVAVARAGLRGVFFRGLR